MPSVPASATRHRLDLAHDTRHSTLGRGHGIMQRTGRMQDRMGGGGGADTLAGAESHGPDAGAGEWLAGGEAPRGFEV